jgi:hypothetical protein
MKRSGSSHPRLISVAEDAPMNTDRRTDDLLDLTRVLLLVQGAILMATTIEALVWASAFPGAGSLVPLLNGASAVVILVARARLRADRRRLRRLVYVVEGLIVAAFAIDTVLAIVLAHSAMPVVAVFSQFVLPVSVIGLLRRIARTAAVPVPAAVPMEVAA